MSQQEQVGHPLVITMWETYGCGMEEVASAVGRELSIPVHAQAFTSEQIEQSEAERAKEGGFARFVRRVGSLHIDDAVADGTARTEQESWVEMARKNTKIVRDTAAQDAIILGRNGAFILKDAPRALHVKLDGHAKDRAALAAELKKIPLDQATKRLPREDQFRRSLSMRTYNFDPTGNEYYTIVLNSPRLGLSETVRLIVEAAKRR